jgi:signal transduction histidine kinase/BarA-like signal transduction histidine kinase
MKTQAGILNATQSMAFRKANSETIVLKKIHSYLKNKIAGFGFSGSNLLSKSNQQKMQIKHLIESEQALLGSKEQLENELLKTKEALCGLSKEKIIFEKKVEQKNQLFSMLSHEIRTPLGGMTGLIRHLLQTEMTTQQRDCLQALQQAAETMFSISCDSLDLAKLEAGKMACHHVDFNLTEVLQSSIRVFQSRAKEKGIDLRLETVLDLPTHLKGDPSRLHQILMNLLSNAIKFTNNGRVSLEVKYSAVSNTHTDLIFTVTDTGCGIPESKMNLLFQEYSQIQNGARTLDPGTGLGLYITKKLTELMGGHVQAQSKENKGSQFIAFIGFDVTIPILPADGRALAGTKSQKNQLANRRFLVVDDNPVNQLFCETILNHAGAEVEFAENGQVALCKLAEQQYDIVLMDVYMPILDGYQTAEQIRSSALPNVQKVPILGLSAAGDSDTIHKCLSSGMNAHLLKPFQEEELITQIKSMLSEVKCS